MVNLANCTKNLFYSPVVHIIHTVFAKNVEKLCTPHLVHFKGKSSYTPSYPHYPHLFYVYYHLSPSKVHQPDFCVYLINLHISTKNTRIILDRNIRFYMGSARVLSSFEVTVHTVVFREVFSCTFCTKTRASRHADFCRSVNSPPFFQARMLRPKKEASSHRKNN